MRIVNLGDTNSILNKFVAELRDVDIQKDSLRFRRNVERIGEIMAYEIRSRFSLLFTLCTNQRNGLIAMDELRF